MFETKKDIQTIAQCVVFEWQWFWEFVVILTKSWASTNLQGELMRSVHTKSGHEPSDLAATRNGDLAYIDPVDRSINLVSGTKVKRLVTLRGWRPLSLCSTSSGDLLVNINKDRCEKMPFLAKSRSLYAFWPCILIINNDCLVYIHSLDFL